MKRKPLIIANGVVITAIAVLVTINLNPDDTKPPSPADKPVGDRSPATSPHPDSPSGFAPAPGGRDRSPEPAREPWETRIDSLLGDSSVSVDEAARELLRIAATRRAPVSLRNDALEHALNLLDDDDYASVQPLLQPSGNLPDLLAQTLLDESLNQTAGYQLQVALSVLRLKPDTELATEARELLEFQLDQQLGDDPEKWQAAVDAYLAEHP